MAEKIVTESGLGSVLKAAADVPGIKQVVDGVQASKKVLTPLGRVTGDWLAFRKSKGETKIALVTDLVDEVTLLKDVRSGMDLAGVDWFLVPFRSGKSVSSSDKARLAREKIIKMIKARECNTGLYVLGGVDRRAVGVGSLKAGIGVAGEWLGIWPNSYAIKGDTIQSSVRGIVNLALANKICQKLAVGNENAAICAKLRMAILDAVFAVRCVDDEFVLGRLKNGVDIKELARNGSSMRTIAKTYSSVEYWLDRVRDIVDGRDDLHGLSNVTQWLESASGDLFENWSFEEVLGDDVFGLLESQQCLIDSMIEPPSCYYVSPLLLAADDGRADICEYFISDGVDIDEKDGRGQTALARAARSGHMEVATVLVNAGCKVNVIDRVGYTPLHEASDGGYDDLVGLLLENGANVNAVDLEGDTPLIIAMDNEVVRKLVDNNCNVNAKGARGETALHRAAFYQGEDYFDEAIRYLVDHGADVSIQNNAGQTPLHFAALGGAAQTGELLTAGAVVDVADKAKNTPLHYACGAHMEYYELLEDRPSAVMALIKSGCNVNAVNGEGKTPLDLAIENELSPDVIEFLKQNGASQSLRLIKGRRR